MKENPKDESTIFNTYTFVKKLVASGVPERQAEAQMEIFIHFIDDKLATKVSLKETETKLQTEMREIEARLTANIKMLEKDIVIKLGSMLVIAMTVLGAMIKFF